MTSGVYGSDRIPQLQDVSQHLTKRTGFRLRPVTGLLSGRDFLNALAFRTFFSTQYIRHPKKPLYTPEPDVIHELIGHAPMLANPAFADFSQILGLASIGATDEQIARLAACYWFSVEFGLLVQDGGLKAYGAGLLSSCGELQHATSPETNTTTLEVRDWNPFDASLQTYPITTYQPVLYRAQDLRQVRQKLLEFCVSHVMHRTFAVQYDPHRRGIRLDTSVELTKGPEEEEEGQMTGIKHWRH